MPKYVDYIDRDKTNNRIENLRDVERSGINSLNRGETRVSKTGLKGCFRRGDRFIGQRVVLGKRIYVGTYPTVSEVEAAFARNGI